MKSLYYVIDDQYDTYGTFSSIESAEQFIKNDCKNLDIEEWEIDDGDINAYSSYYIMKIVKCVKPLPIVRPKKLMGIKLEETEFKEVKNE